MLINQTVNTYINLISKKIPLSITGVTSRNFNYLKSKKIIRTNEKIENKKSPNVKLNLFEAFWLLIVNDLRKFGFSDKNLKVVHDFLFTDIIQLEKSGALETSVDLLKSETIKNDIDPTKLNFEFLKSLKDNIPSEELVIFSNLGRSIIHLIQKKKSEIWITISDDENDQTQSIIVNIIDEISLGHNLISDEFKEVNRPILKMPLQGYLEKILQLEIKPEILTHFKLLTDRENQIIEHVLSGNFKEITIKNNEGKWTLKKTTNKDIHGTKVKELKQILGCKNYQSVDLKIRNDQHIYVESTETHNLQ